MKTEIIKKILEWGPYIEPVLKKVLEKGKDGVLYLQMLFESNHLNNRIKKNNKEIDAYYKEIGEIIFKKQININELDVKEIIKRIEKSKKEISEIKEQIEKLSSKAKNVEVFNDLPEITTLINKLDEENAKKVKTKKSTKKKK